MTIRLVPLEIAGNAGDLAAEFARGFGGDETAPRQILEQTRNLHEAHPRPAPWGSYVAYDGSAAVGTGAFKWAPAGGAVEIAYMTFPAYEGRGYATAMAEALTDLAFANGVRRVIAHTLPEENASSRALRRNGFVHAGEVIDPEDGAVWRWERGQ